MPKEVICKPPSNPNDPGEPYCTHVGWNADWGEVTVGTVGRGERSIYWLLFGGGIPLGGEGVSEELLALRKQANHEYLLRFGTLVLELARDYLKTDEHGIAGGEAAFAADLLNKLDVNYGSSGIYANHDRNQVNALIKALRRARDAAFGADE